MAEAPHDREPAERANASRRTDLAVERTQLARWRTGLTALVLAIAGPLLAVLVIALIATT